MDAVTRVKNMVRHSLIASPGVTNQELYNRAREIAPQAVEGLSLRQFHARFRLPVMVHEMGPRRPRRPRADRSAHTESRPKAAKAETTSRTPGRSGGRKRAEPAPARQAEVREILVEFAVALETAESRSDLVRVMAGVDDFAARIVQVIRGDHRVRAVAAPAESDAAAETGLAATVEPQPAPVQTAA